MLTPRHKEIQSYSEYVPNIKNFVDLYNWSGIEYWKVYIKTAIRYLKENNPEITLRVLCIDLNIEITKLGEKQRAAKNRI